MSGWQLEAFDKAYKEIQETGTSPIKKQKLQNQQEQLTFSNWFAEKFRWFNVQLNVNI